MTNREATTKRGGVMPIIFLTVLIDLIGFGIVIPVLPLYAARFQASALEIGLLMGIFSGLQFLLAPLFGRWSDRIGRKPILTLSMVGAVVGYLVMGFADSVFMLFIARMIAGVSGASIGTAQAAIADVTSAENRVRGMGIIGAAFGIGFILGPAIGGLMSTISPAAPFFFAAMLAFANVLLLWRKFPETLLEGDRAALHRTSAWGEALAHSQLRRVILSYFLLITGFSIMTGMFALFTAKKLGLDATQNGLIFAFIGVIAAVIQGRLIGGLVHRFGDLALARVGAVLVGGGLLGLPFVAGIPSLLFVSALLAAGNSLMMPTLSALASRQADAQSQGRTLGVLQSGASLARFIGPLIGGALFHWGTVAGSSGVLAFWTGALLVFAAGWLTPKIPE